MVILRSCFIALLLIAVSWAQPPVPKQPTKGQQQPPPKTAPPAKTETFVQKALRILGITVTPAALKGDEADIAGDIWVYDLTMHSNLRLPYDGSYRSPVFLPDEAHLLVLKGEDVVRLALNGGAEETIVTLNGVKKLVGVSQTDGAEVLFVAQDSQQQFTVGLLAWQSKQVTMLPYDKEAAEDTRLLAHLRSWEYAYEGGRKRLFTRIETKEGANGTVEWSDVYYQQENQPAENLSHCNGGNCGQPSLSVKARYVAYLKAAR